jgi:N6-L-threonylcarbamoyladenine synthase
MDAWGVERTTEHFLLKKGDAIRESMRILSIETSCDETAAAILDDGRQVLASVVASQTPSIRRIRGRARDRIALSHRVHVARRGRSPAGGRVRTDGSDLDAVAVTRGPGLVGSLLVGVETAKTLAWRWRKPLIAVHHTVGHLLSVFCELPEGRSRFLEVPPDDSEPASTEWREQDGEAQHGRTEQAPVARGNRNAAPAVFDFPFLGLAISGGHSSLVRVEGPTEMRLLGSTLDDAPGEAYDKVAKVLGLGYPGGPEVDRRAALGNPEAFDLPRPIPPRARIRFLVQRPEDRRGARNRGAGRPALVPHRRKPAQRPVRVVSGGGY